MRRFGERIGMIHLVKSAARFFGSKGVIFIPLSLGKASVYAFNFRRKLTLSSWLGFIGIRRINKFEYLHGLIFSVVCWFVWLEDK